MVGSAATLSEAFHLELLGHGQKGVQLLLGDVHLSGVHEFQDGREVLEGDVFQDDDGVLGGVLLQ